MFAFALLVLTLLSLSAISYAILPATYTTYAGGVNCQDCSVGMCTCSVTGCSGGLLRIWRAADDCTGMWDYEYTVVGGSVDAKPAETGTMYARVYDGKQYCTSCDSINVKESFITSSTTSATETTSETTATTGTTTSSGGGDSTITIFIILLIILVIGAVVYYFLILKKKPAAGGAKTYEDLYRKWPKRH